MQSETTIETGNSMQFCMLPRIDWAIGLEDVADGVGILSAWIVAFFCQRVTLKCWLKKKNLNM